MNLLNFTEADLDRKIYRIMKPEHVYSLFMTRQNVLVSPRLWDDPFENFILKAPAVLPQGEMVEWRSEATSTVSAGLYTKHRTLCGESTPPTRTEFEYAPQLKGALRPG